jgi:ADP-heptose:LPS heptosyltransferase
VRAGFDYKNRGRFLNRRLVLPREGFVRKHMIEYYADIGRLLGVEIKDKVPELHLTPGSLIQAKTVLDNNGLTQRRYIVLAPGGGATWGSGARLRLWPVKHYVGLLKLLEAKINFDGAVVIGASDDRIFGEEIKKSWHGRLVNCCGMTDLVTSAALIKMSRCFIGSDSGIVHLAASLDVPIVTFYGAPDPRVYGPHPEFPRVAALTIPLVCRPCYTNFRYNDACQKVSCLNDLTPEIAFRQLEKMNFFSLFTP